MSQELIQVATDVATYVGAVSAGVSANALTDSARAVVGRVIPRLKTTPKPGLLVVTPELVDEIANLLRSDSELYKQAKVGVSGPTIDRSIIINATTVSDVRMRNT